MKMIRLRCTGALRSILALLWFLASSVLCLGTVIAQLNSASLTPATDVFPIPNEYHQGGPPHSHFDRRYDVDGTNWQLIQLPLQGTRTKIVRGMPVQLIELRGWLRSVPESPKGNCRDILGPDVSYGFELDPTWAHQATQLEKIFRVGSVNTQSINPILNTITDLAAKTVATPTIHTEVHSYDRTKGIRYLLPPPSDWLANTEPCKSVDVYWPFNVYRPLADKPQLAAGQYVRMVGSIVSDAPHEEENDLQKHWMRGGPKDPNNPARWTEMHSPDIIEVIEPDLTIAAQKHRSYVVGATLWSDNCFVGTCAKGVLDAFIPGPEPRPQNAVGVDYRELILDGTNYSTIIEGNGQSGATISKELNGIRVHVAVRGTNVVNGHRPGKFAALYVVSWKKAETCKSFDPQQVQVAVSSGGGWVVNTTAGGILAYPDEQSAQKAATIIRSYQINEQCRIGEDPVHNVPFQFYLANQVSPQGPLAGESCWMFNPPLSVKFVNGQWWLSDNADHSIGPGFGPHEDQAQAALADFLKYGFTYECVVPPVMLYYRK